MFKSVFAKYVTAFAAIILVSFLTVALIVASMVTDYASDSKKESIDWFARTAQTIVEGDYAKEDGAVPFAEYVQRNREHFKTLLDAVAQSDTSLTLFLTDRDGRVLLTGSHNDGIATELTVDTSVMNRVFASEGYSDRTTLKLFADKHLVSAYSVRSSDDSAVGAVFVCSSSAREEALVKVMTETIIMTSLWVMLAAFIAVYFISDRIISPLNHMKSAVKEYAKGNFEPQIVVRGNDEISELSAAVNSMAKSLHHLETMRNSFLANVSHDLRTPMTTIAGFIDGINSGAIPPEKHAHYLAIISTEVHRLSRLVTELLDISKLESGDRKFLPETFDVCEMARLILISFEQKIDEKRLDVSFESDEDTVLAFADKDAVHQVLYNLCDNAIKFSNEGGKYRIAIRRGEKQRISVSVFNEGVGIPKEDLPFVFDRFYKTDKSRGLDKSGAGLGLYIAKTIMEAQGENISVDSEVGKYCAFTFTLSESPRK